MWGVGNFWGISLKFFYNICDHFSKVRMHDKLKGRFLQDDNITPLYHIKW